MGCLLMASRSSGSLIYLSFPGRPCPRMEWFRPDQSELVARSSGSFECDSDLATPMNAPDPDRKSR